MAHIFGDMPLWDFTQCVVPRGTCGISRTYCGIWRDSVLLSDAAQKAAIEEGTQKTCPGTHFTCSRVLP